MGRSNGHNKLEVMGMFFSPNAPIALIVSNDAVSKIVSVKDLCTADGSGLWAIITVEPDYPWR
ncbi:hypothetical protein BWK47_12820 [Synechocystis sp. CACIAM 05]|nr:hypothetical protein BWK47_12820 [Synechocystis sp. CACIAM 05]